MFKATLRPLQNLHNARLQLTPRLVGIHSRGLAFSPAAPCTLLAATHPTNKDWSRKGIAGATALTGLGITLATLQRPAVLCEASSPKNDLDDLPPPPPSSVRLYELSFGTVCGICAGVFIKKGAKAIAFVFGGVFVMLQYFTSLRFVRVDWQRAESAFEQRFYTKSAGAEGYRPPTVYKLWRWLAEFLTTDFQPRASFLAGMALGFRIG